MIFEELDERFPNGFYDAKIIGLTLDYPNRTAMIQMSLRGNSPDRPNRDEYARAVLMVRGFYYFSIDAPDADHLPYHEGDMITVDGLPEDSSQFPLFDRLKPTLPAGAFCCRFYVHDWNSFIHLAAADAAFFWVT